MAEGLSDKQQAFIDHYVECGFNATEAARRAGYSQATARQQGQRLLTNVDIKAEIARRLDEHAMPANEALARIGDIARGDMLDFLNESGDIDLARAREAGKLHLVKTRSITKEGERIELYSKFDALSLIAKHHGLLGGIDWTKIPQAIVDAIADGRLTVDDLKRLAAPSQE